MTDLVINEDLEVPQPPGEPLVAVSLQDVQILEDHVRVVIAGGIEKIVSLEDFRNILNASLGTSEETKMDGFNLPSNVFYFAKSGAQLQLSCYYQSRISPIQYNGRTRNILMPNLVVSHTLNKTGEQAWVVRSTKYFCTDLSVGRLPREFIGSINTSKHVFLMPMSNTYQEANMCFGANNMPTRFTENNLRGLDWYYQYMFESPFNDDLGIIAIGHSMTVSEWYTHLEKLATEGGAFPYAKIRGFSAS